MQHLTVITVHLEKFRIVSAAELKWSHVGVVLFFLVQPPPQKLLPEHAQTLERYAWESFDPHSQCKFISALDYLSIVMCH